MRRQGLGLIVNLSSVAGKVSTPFAGWYSATKHAVEALSDALRLEVKTFGIRVMLIEPGAIKTGFDGIALDELRRTAKLDAYRGLRPGRDGFLRMRPWPRDRCEGGPRATEAKGHAPVRHRQRLAHAHPRAPAAGRRVARPAHLRLARWFRAKRRRPKPASKQREQVNAAFRLSRLGCCPVARELG